MPGIWSGNGVQPDGITFDPLGQPSPVTVTFTSDVDCINAETTTITIQPVNMLVLSMGEICEADGFFDLNTLLPAPTAGTWTGAGVQADGFNFNPTGLLGSNFVTFTPSENCVSGDLTTVTVYGEEMTLIEETYCTGSGDFIQVGADFYDEAMPIGTTTLPTAAGCDSIVNVNLIFTTPQPGIYENTLCPGGSETIGGIVFDETMPMGNAILQTPQGCDSTVMVTLTFGNEVTNDITETYCAGSGDFIQVGADFYDEAMPIGTTTLPTAAGCDSIVNVNLIFTTPQPGIYENTLCPGGSETIGGIVFDETMPMGNAILQTPQGCDSTVVVTLTFGNEVTNDITETYCAGSGDFIQVGADFYDEAMPIGTTTLPTAAGCDSIVNVNLIFTTPQPGIYENTLCPGGSETIGGIVFDETMPMGNAILQTPSGCDSTVVVTLTFANEVTNDITETYCAGSGDFIQVGTDIYDEAMPIGTTTLPTAAGCDSIVNVNLIFTTPQPGIYENTLCPGGSETIGGIVFDETMPMGNAILQTPSGCDSTVVVTLTFANEVTNDITETYCAGSGDFIQVGTDIYDEAMPIGTTTLPTAAGCDSIVNVNLIFTTPQPGIYENTLCPGGSETIGGIVFDETMPMGNAILQTPQGCDSTVMVTLTFGNEVTNDITETYCAGSGDFIQVGADFYDETTPIGTTTLPTAAGCDSIVNVNLIFTTPQPGIYENTLCPGGSETIGGIVFDETMPMGNAILQTPQGCDSTVMVTLTFGNEVTNDITETYCAGSGDFIQVGADFYDEAMPIGTTTLPTAAGCDSIVNVNLIFTTPQPGIYENTLCPGGSETIGGIVFDETMPMGNAILQTPQGCDSTVMVTLTFGNEVTNDITETYCAGSGDFIQVGADFYDEAMPIGTTTLPTAAGCDSIVNVNLIFTTPQPGIYENTLCPGGSETIGGIVFDETMPMGNAILQTPQGCDSTVMVTLTFGNEVTNDITETYCAGSGDFIQVGADFYDEAMPIGTTTLPTAAGCDSIVNVNLIFTTPQPGIYENTLCPGGSETIGGIVFDETMPAGNAILQTPQGCDSTVMVTLTFGNEVTNDITETYCAGSGDFIQVGADFYDEAMPIGTTTLPTAAGCDSIVNVNLIFTTPQPGIYENTLCPGGSETIGGIVFDETMPMGNAILQTPQGCDSTVMVTLTFGNEVTNDITETYCAGSGDFIQVGADFYDETTPIGTTTLPTPAGCDSIVNVNLIFTTPQPGIYENTLCPGGSETIGGIVFDETMPMGNAILQTPQGCDSTVMVTLTFGNEVTNDITETYCAGSGDFIQVGADFYDEAMPIGTTTLPTAAGCDSIVNVNLIFTTPQPGIYENTLCPGGSETIGGIVFDETMPMGNAILQTPQGCDSTVMVTLTFGNEVTNDITETYCAGSGDFIQVGADFYDEAMPIGTTTLPTAAGCDSIVNVNLIFTTPQPGIYENTLCPGGSETIGGIVFDETMPMGNAILQTPQGCDSTVVVTLTFGNEVTNDITETYCADSGDFIQVGADFYDEAMPIGTTTLPTAAGCDSIVNVNLIFTTPQPGIYENTLCPGGSETIGGIVFDETMPMGNAILQTPQGCDSTVVVTLTFANEVTNNINETYCTGSGDFIQVGTDIYDETTPIGTTTLPTPAGCDSIVNVNLIFTTPQPGIYENTLCPGGSETIGGIVFDETMPMGNAILQTPSGCDSTVVVTLTFANEVTNNINETYCTGSGDFIQVGTDIYDETTPIGTTTLPTPAGCDSIVNVNLIFTTPQPGIYENTLCPGGSETIGGIVFDETMPAGNAILQTPQGCDSTVVVTLTFANEIVVTLTETLCPGESIMIDGITYNENNTMGETTIPNGSYLGCDSTTNISVDFYPVASSDFSATLDMDETIEIGGVIFSSNNPNGIVILPMSSINGCDSTINVNLQFTTEFGVELFAFSPFCFGENTGGITIDTVENMNFPIFVTLNGVPRGNFVSFPIEINDLTAGFYSLGIFSNIGEVTTLEIEVPTAPQLILNAGSDETIRIGDLVDLSGQTNIINATWQWSPPLYLECDTCLKTVAIPLEGITYTLTGTTSEGCIVSDNMTIFVERGDAIFAPNIFSPNNDGVNDMFYFYTTNEVSMIRTFRIFDRWGAMVFDRAEIQPNDPMMGWDGMHRGKIVEQGVYVFFAEIELIDGRMETIKGGVTVIR